MRKFYLTFAFTIFVLQIISAQQTNFPLGNQINYSLNKEINKLNVSVNTGFKPLLKSEFNKYYNLDSVIYQYRRAEIFYTKHKKNWFWRKSAFEDFYYVKTKKFRLSINPLLNLEFGKIRDTVGNYSINTRGVELKGDIGKHLSFYSSFRENQAYFQPYLNNWIVDRQVVPGQGAIKTFNKTGQDFSRATGNISFTPVNWANLQVGYDKNFIGEGYRSMLLSDNAFNYPFLKLSFSYKGFKYVTMITQFEDFSQRYHRYHTKKHAAFNYLSYSFKNRVEVGIFEGLIYHTTDTTKHIYSRIPADYFIPVIGTRTAINGLSSDNNTLLGLNLKIKVIDNIQLYGQIAVDELSSENTAYQIGIKVFDALFSKLRNSNLYFQAEYNRAGQETYTQDSLKYQTWTHYNQELAHPFGRNFSEIVTIVNYSLHNFFVNFKYNSITFTPCQYSIYGNEDCGTMPAILTSSANISHKTITAGWTINPRTYLQIFGGIDIRSETTTVSNQTNYIFLGLRTTLNNFYYDF